MKNVRFFCFILECSGKKLKPKFLVWKHVVLRIRLWRLAKCSIFQLCPYRPGIHLGESAISNSWNFPWVSWVHSWNGTIHMLGWTHQGSLCSPCAQWRTVHAPHEPLLSSLHVPLVPLSSLGDLSRKTPLHIPGNLSRKTALHIPVCISQETPAGKQLCTSPPGCCSEHTWECPLRAQKGLCGFHLLLPGTLLRKCSQNTLKHPQQRQEEGKKSKESILLTVNSTAYCSYETKILLPEWSEPLIQLTNVVWQNHLFEESILIQI